MSSHSPNESEPPQRRLRHELVETDRDAIGHLVMQTGFFRADEVAVAVELVDERLRQGEASGYEFVVAELGNVVVGYACFGAIACSLGSYDLYWIAVSPAQQRGGVGRALIRAVEGRVRTMGGRHLYIETSGRPQYAPTREFYRRNDYEVVATLADFYDVGDDKVVWRKVLDCVS